MSLKVCPHRPVSARVTQHDQQKPRYRSAPCLDSDLRALRIGQAGGAGPIRILYVVPSLRNRGPVRVVQQLTTALDKAGIKCEVWYFDESDNQLPFACPVRRIHFFGLARLRGYDVIHCHGIRSDAWLGLRRVLGLRVPSVSTLHCYIGEDLYYQYGRLISMVFTPLWLCLLRAHTRVAVLTRDAYKYYAPKMRQGKTVVVHNGISTWERRPLAAAPHDAIKALRQRVAFIIGSCAQVTQRKGLEQIVSLLSRHTDLGFVLVGDGPSLGELRTLAEFQGVSNRCLFTGFREDARDFLPWFDCYTMPSRSEGYPIALLEAAVVGLPVLVSDIPVFRDILATDCGAFFTLDDAKSLDRALDEIRRGRTALGSNLHNLYSSGLTAEAMAAEYLVCYREAVEEMTSHV